MKHKFVINNLHEPFKLVVRVYKYKSQTTKANGAIHQNSSVLVTINDLPQIGRRPGLNAEVVLYSGDCKAADCPAPWPCTNQWEYRDKHDTEWKHDPTITLACKGGDGNGRIYLCTNGGFTSIRYIISANKVNTSPQSNCF